ncbi:hypothetical protein DP113_08980 [Brasilonema octagenarum UFV-E1]|uniref:Uncharacterized protein n=2 Tax=Brasilonema TaxID=383614 RepID=A0A856MG08_9CYAN|nr:hypothetical protein [Brasilonema octagenarum UFV-OR1]QDL08027.1 hypothetical protein DP114_09025 [Brasilonema sennae CENA114]QDL14386.1 hypothetical protein DP113_08980 [Brasilonema octagenarum UFV-E1]
MTNKVNFSSFLNKKQLSMSSMRVAGESGVGFPTKIWKKWLRSHWLNIGVFLQSRQNASNFPLILLPVVVAEFCMILV